MVPGWIFVNLFKKAWNNPDKSKTFTALVAILGIAFIAFIIIPLVLIFLGLL